MTTSGGGVSFVYQVLNPSLGLQASTVGNPVRQTSIQGAVTELTTATPESASFSAMAAGRGLLGFVRRRRAANLGC